jgi:hypothetical protein
MILKCEDCGDKFEHFVLRKSSSAKKFCDYCLSIRARASARVNSKKTWERKRAEREASNGLVCKKA